MALDSDRTLRNPCCRRPGVAVWLALTTTGFRGPRAPAFAILQAGPQITEMETGSDVQFVERVFNMVKFAQRAVRQDLCPSMGHLTILVSFPTERSLSLTEVCVLMERCFSRGRCGSNVMRQ